MPDLSEYRQRFETYHAELTDDDYEYLTGRKSASDGDHIRSDYSDLFSLSTIEELDRAHEEVSSYRVTERTAIRRLKAFAIGGYVFAQAAGITSEIDHYEQLAEVEWDQKRFPYGDLDKLIAREVDAKKRRELAARRADIRSGATGLLAERVDILRQSIKRTGFVSFSRSRLDLLGIDSIALGSLAEKLLSKTENGYVSAISAFLPATAGVSIDEATDADLDHLEHYARFDAWFSPERMRPLYRELFDGFGFKSEKQTNLSLTMINAAGRIHESGCFPVRVPEDIRLAVNSAGGQRSYRRFFAAAGQAQSFAWTSKNLHPEFRYVGQFGDSALIDAWAGLVAGLVCEGQWLQGSLGFVEHTDFHEVLKLIRLVEIRRHAAMHLYEMKMLESDHSTSSTAAYVDRIEDALKVRADSSGPLVGIGPACRHGNHLRGVVFEFQLREFLRMRFGSRWWTSRKAGEMIIDLWNTGQQYSVESMAEMIGLGEPDYDWLAAEIL